ncbi:MAG TPA: methionine--tRNA ligase [Kofleriaceae bacterium]|nr:methionine--tRNA ligase [Kofleriaceae bacterium]
MTTSTFISTAIPYVNARPHLGFAYELVLADIIARHRRRRGHAVTFTTGTDEHSLKNVVAAAREGISTRALVDRNAGAFRELAAVLDLTPDDFVRTSTDARHRDAVVRLWRACSADLYRASWRGRYCIGCEAFVDACDEHATPLEEVAEENWFFRLSRHGGRIRDAIESGRVQILPDSARAETLAFLAGAVRDISVSRDAARSGGWGIPVPDDPAQVIYVWFDALANYLVPGDWHSWRERTHVIGKGITRFHAVYWLAFLLAAELPLPERLFVHGYLTLDGKKIAKSGEGFDVVPVVERCGVDALRWFYARQCRARADSDVSIDAILACHDTDLANRIGNLAHRTATLAAKVGTAPHVSSELDASALPGRIDAALDAFAIDEAAAAIIETVDAANRYLDRAAPWKLAPRDAAAALAPVREVVRIVIDELEPFVPSTSRALRNAEVIPRRRGQYSTVGPV